MEFDFFSKLPIKMNKNGMNYICLFAVVILHYQAAVVIYVYIAKRSH
jgi:hypothetical protein